MAAKLQKNITRLQTLSADYTQQTDSIKLSQCMTAIVTGCLPACMQNLTAAQTAEPTRNTGQKTDNERQPTL